jgi:hypothetical protein
MRPSIASTTQTPLVSNTVPVSFRVRLAAVTAFLQRLPLPLLQLLFRLATGACPPAPEAYHRIGSASGRPSRNCP